MNTPRRSSVRILTVDELEMVARDGRIAAIRWDVIPWSTVLDVDVLESEKRDAHMYRAWLVFHGVLSIDIPMNRVNIPTGMWITSGIDIEESQEREGFKRARFNTFIAMHTHETEMLVTQWREIEIIARQFTGAISIESAIPGKNGLEWENRNRLASDEDFRELLCPQLNCEAVSELRPPEAPG